MYTNKSSIKGIIGSLVVSIIFSLLAFASYQHAIGGSRTGKWDLPWVFMLFFIFGAITWIVKTIKGAYYYMQNKNNAVDGCFKTKDLTETWKTREEKSSAGVRD